MSKDLIQWFVDKLDSGDVDGLSASLQNDREFILALVKQDGHALYYASKELKNDREVVLAAVRQDVFALQYASEDLKNDKEFLKIIRT